MVQLVTKLLVVASEGLDLLTKGVVLISQSQFLVLELFAGLEGNTKLASHVVALGSQSLLLDFEYSDFAVGAVEFRPEGLDGRVESCC
jgi:hypothetical protein